MDHRVVVHMMSRGVKCVGSWDIVARTSMYYENVCVLMKQYYIISIFLLACTVSMQQFW